MQLFWYFCLMPEVKPIPSRYRFHLLLLLTALAWIVLFDWLMQCHLQPFISPDAVSYQESAEKLYILFRADAYRPLLMAFLTGIPYVFGGDDSSIYAFGDVINVLCWLASLLLMLEILNQFLKPKIAFFFALPMVFLVGINILVFELATESIYLLMMVAACYFLTRYYKTEAFKFLCIALMILVLSMLVKPGSKFLAIAATVFFIREIIFNYGSKFSWLVYASYLAVLLQCAAIKVQFHNFTLSYIDAVTYYDYLGAKAESRQIGKPFKEVWLERATYIYSRPYPEQKQIAARDFLDQLQTNTAPFFTAYLSNLKENATHGSVNVRISENIKQINYFNKTKILVYSVSTVQNWSLSIVGFLLSLSLLWRRKHSGEAFLFPAFFVLYIMLLSGISCSEGDRFHVVTFPFTIVLIANFVAQKRKDFART